MKFFAKAAIAAAIFMAAGPALAADPMSSAYGNTVTIVYGSGVATTAQGVDAGLDVITVEVVDLAGNRRTSTVPFALDAVEFTAFFNAPTAGSIVQAATPVRINVGFDHNRLSDTERAAAFVQVLSDRQGLLVVDGGASTLAPASDAFISTLSEGSHILTARVFAGGRSPDELHAE